MVWKPPPDSFDRGHGCRPGTGLNFGFRRRTEGFGVGSAPMPGPDTYSNQNLHMKALSIMFLMACWIGTNVSGLAQSFGIQNINSTRGLRNNSIWGIGQDTDGFIWMASAHGVQRFDGNSFQTISRKEGLADSEAMDFFPNPLTGELYVQVYPGKASVLKNGSIDRKKGRNLERLFSSRSLLNISVNRSQKTLFVLADQQAYETDFDFRIRRRFPQKPFEGNVLLLFYSGNVLHRLIEHTTKGLLLSTYRNHRFSDPKQILPGKRFNIKFNTITDKGCLLYDDQNIIYSFNFQTRTMRQMARASEEISGLLIDRDSLLWYGKNNGVHWVNLRKPTEGGHLLGDQIVGNIFEDKFRQIWITTITNGVYWIADKNIRNIHVDSKTHSRLPVQSYFKNQNTTLFGFSNNSFWVRSPDQNGLLELSQSRIFNRVMKEREHENQLFVLHDFGVYALSSKKTVFKGVGLKDFHVFEQGKLLTAGLHGLILSQRIADSYQAVDTLVKNKVLCFTLVDDSTVIYYSTRGQFVRSLRKNSPERPIPTSTGEPVSVTSYFRHRKAIYITDHEGNLYRFSKGTMVTLMQNLFGNNEGIRQLLLDDRGTLHAISDRSYAAIFHFGEGSKEQRIILNYKNGLTHTLVNHLFLYRDTVYISGNDGVSVFRAENIQNRFPEKVFVGEVWGGGTRIAHPEKPFHLVQTQTNLKMECHPMYFNFPEPVLLSYQLYRNQQIRDSGRTQPNAIVFSDLKAGDYRLLVTAFNPFNPRQRSQTLTLQFHKEPFWMENLWVQTVLYLLSLGLAVAIFVVVGKRRNRREKARMRMQQRITQLELLALRSQLDPHFIFNSLNSIKEFVRKNDVVRSQHYLDEFSALMRTTLDKSKQRNLLLSEEIEYLRKYLFLEQVRFDQKFDFKIGTEGLPAALLYIPSMMVQPFVENSIRHGQIGSLPYPGHLEIQFEVVDEEFLVCRITDNGRGLGEGRLEPTPGVHSVGIIRDRIRLYNDAQTIQIRFDIRNRDDGQKGVVVEIFLPIQYNATD
jgi:hypothetical protein